ncbi:MAG TPA: ABC transporter substrate-binding protein [Actinophytocola sp.]|uniref:ABC transporter substrate-binding protein n=1 Tax=Actinophytocola sp. TaxID=1872138 RepID=UPI002DDCDD45|nr:ABC transporter substrate-binding protein [Actinophytocola sp.]HEV2784023.1 ABC transporter substrate-binding protein [Actinophytocola sp.]
MSARGRARRLAVVVLVGVLAATGCANRERAAGPATGAPAAQAFPAQVTAPDGSVILLRRKPERIVSLSASSTEALFAIGAGEQVVAVDDQSTFPADAPRTTLSGLTPNVEAIAAYQPDLVVAQADANDLVAGMEKLHRPVLLLPSARSIDDAYAQFRLLGKATGHVKEAEDLATRTQDEIAGIVAGMPKPATPLSYYHELTTELYTATSKTFIGQVYGLFGLTNVADPADTVDSGGYPKLSAEHILRSNPDLIFLADTKCCGQDAATVGARPGWSTLKAVRGGNVVALDDDLASRWGPRIVDLVRSVGEAVSKASQTAGG